METVVESLGRAGLAYPPGEPSWSSFFAAVFTAAFFLLLTFKLVTLALELDANGQLTGKGEELYTGFQAAQLAPRYRC